MQNKLLLIIGLILILPIKYNAQNKSEKKLVGLAYTTWHQSIDWKNVWGKPELGYYTSDNKKIIRQHGKWMAAYRKSLTKYIKNILTVLNLKEFIKTTWVNRCSFYMLIRLRRLKLEFLNGMIPGLRYDG